MTVIDQIDRAMARSRFTLRDVWRWLCEGRLTLLIGRGMSGSFMRHGGRIEIVHVGGRWNASDATWMFDRVLAACRATGLLFGWEGRPGWARFLRQQGALNHELWKYARV